MKSIVVDNFFEDPYSVIELANKQKYYPRNQEQYYEGIRTPNLKDIDFDFYTRVSTKIIYKYFETNHNYKIQGHMNFHKLRKIDQEDPHWLNDRIHKDKYVTSTIIYLSPETPMGSGTQLYRKIGEKHVPDIIYNNKFNRMIMFPGEVPHSAMDISGGNQDRLTLLFFIESIEKHEE